MANPGGDQPQGAPPAPTVVRTGCTAAGEEMTTHGPDTRMRVALTFDDGPSAYTSTVLRALRRHGAHATFFVVGRQMAGREGLMRRMLRDGNEIGNHTAFHAPNPGPIELAAANLMIESATGFTPCHFRPPEGIVDDALIERAHELGMGTVTWSVDTRDWASQEPATILSNVLSVVEPGSVVLMHDGGGDRSGTAAIAPELIDQLKERGFKLVTVTELLGERFTTSAES